MSDSIPRFAYYDADAPSKIERVQLIRLGYIGNKTEAGFLLTPQRTARINLYQEVEKVPTAVTPDKRDPRLFWIRPEHPLDPGCYALIVPFMRTPDQRIDDDDAGYAFRIDGPRSVPLARWMRGGFLRIYTTPRTDDAYSHLKGQMLNAPQGAPLLFVDLVRRERPGGTAQLLVVSRVGNGQTPATEPPPEGLEQTAEFEKPALQLLGSLRGSDECEFVWIRHPRPLTDDFMAQIDAQICEIGSRGRCYVAVPDAGELVVIAACMPGQLAGGLGRLPAGSYELLDWGLAYVSVALSPSH